MHQDIHQLFDVARFVINASASEPWRQWSPGSLGTANDDDGCALGTCLTDVGSDFAGVYTVRSQQDDQLPE